MPVGAGQAQQVGAIPHHVVSCPPEQGQPAGKPLKTHATLALGQPGQSGVTC
ncbi:hypothetical protein [Photobacterium sp. OFAV2-7]|uniref:hypothetical protein n=1 Tax=Photobacterium sp. OFAV2-7 TaxID=2917748 RepID=UPI001EF51690|nr:hypothetical protein [Photobacterium sp. OFAV2-7]MCG7584580.1 hypothetical protein [Photobacterium sp. OFAV2-7]